MIPDNVWFYTLSTIAQTCAAILALGGAFTVFKLDKVQTAIGNYRGRVISIIRAWRKESKVGDKFYDESAKDIFDQYKTIVRDNEEKIFDNPDLEEVYTRYENTRISHKDKNGISITIDNIKLDREEKKRWCNRMANLLEENIKIEGSIYTYLKIALVLLTASIISSIFMLNFLPEWSVDKYIFCVISGWSIGSIIFSGFAVWKIAKFKPIL